MKTNLKVLIVVIVTLAVIAGLVYAVQQPAVRQALVLGNTYYISPTGSDSNAGTATAPWKTIQKAADTMVAGDTVLVHGGNYPVSRTWITKSGRSDAYITFKAYPGEHPVISSTDYQTIHILGTSSAWLGYVTFDGLTITNSNQCGSDIMIEYSHHVRVVNTNLHGAGGTGVSADIGTDYITIENNVVYDNSWGCSSWRGSGIGLGKMQWYDRAAGFHSIIRNNLVYHNWHNPALVLNHSDGNGIIVDSENSVNAAGDSPPALIENNVAFDNAGACLNVFESSNVTLRNNTCYQNVSDTQITYAGEIYIGASQNVTAYNNILFARSPNKTINIDQSTSMNFDYNLTYNGPQNIKGSHDIVANPMFITATIDPLTANFHLQSGSPAIDKALGSQAPANDYDGNQRPQGAGYDIGAYEYISGGATNTPAPPTMTYTVTMPPTATKTLTITPSPIPPTFTKTFTPVPPTFTLTPTFTQLPVTITPQPPTSTVTPLPTSLCDPDYLPLGICIYKVQP